MEEKKSSAVIRAVSHDEEGRKKVERTKSGRGGKYTWEGPDGLAENELMAAPPAIDEKDPNYVDEEEEEKIVRDENNDVAELVVGEVEVAKAAEARKGVARVELDPHINLN
ncbi:hypothetical protein Gotri_016693 [Gossypium trilobum]|uniref:Uncharacterized protein n=1 Tax=Gossypium trilobum TaxID=34281 RepID=A0A7J9E491_9ROSI|nr:hypothetical protein [Gossypium trilobum]